MRRLKTPHQAPVFRGDKSVAEFDKNRSGRDKNNSDVGDDRRSPNLGSGPRGSFQTLAALTATDWRPIAADAKDDITDSALPRRE
jgi:hypothetical protein